METLWEFWDADSVIDNFLKPLFFANSNKELIQNMIIFKIVYTVAVAVALAVIPAPYGRFTSSKYGLMIEPKLAWMAQECPAFFVPLWLILCSEGLAWKASFVNKVLISYLMLHYFQRSFIYAALIRGGKSTPITSFINAVGICGLNGLMQGLYLINYVVYPGSWFLDPRFILGSVLFLAGMAINIHSDYVLRNLRKPGETGYKIPYGGVFQYVTSANYFGEALEWWGFAAACWSPTALIFATFATLFLAMRAVRYHKFYLEKFEDYPANRKIFLPFVWFVSFPDVGPDSLTRTPAKKGRNIADEAS